MYTRITPGEGPIPSSLRLVWFEAYNNYKAAIPPFNKSLCATVTWESAGYRVAVGAIVARKRYRDIGEALLAAERLAVTTLKRSLEGLTETN